ncbi:MAG: hypothetical protein H5T72_07760 [Actinobacteria bacterium]|nr:hypothetical protein [Actinomycetota bacterium]
MRRIIIWYSNLGRRSKILLWTTLAIVAALVLLAVAWMVLSPEKVLVRYGTIVRDPIDNHVWEDNTQTAWVSPSEASNYRVEYIDRYSPEHEEKIKKEREAAAAEEKELQESTGLQALETSIPAQTFQDLNTLQQNIEVMGQDIISGMEVAGQVSSIKSTLVNYRNQVASMPLPPELEPLRQEALQIFDMYIRACDLYLQAIATGDLSLVDEANALIQEAAEKIQALLPSY